MTQKTLDKVIFDLELAAYEESIYSGIKKRTDLLHKVGEIRDKDTR